MQDAHDIHPSYEFSWESDRRSVVFLKTTLQILVSLPAVRVSIDLLTGFRMGRDASQSWGYSAQKHCASYFLLRNDKWIYADSMPRASLTACTFSSEWAVLLLPLRPLFILHIVPMVENVSTVRWVVGGFGMWAVLKNRWYSRWTCTTDFCLVPEFNNFCSLNIS